MTRINVVPPEALIRQHLVAEYRELPRVFTLAKAAKLRGLDPCGPAIPALYTLGTGHVKFFYPRLRWLVKRHALLVAEMDDRGYRAAIRTMFLSAGLSSLGSEWLGDWTPTAEALRLNLDRIAERGGLRSGHTYEEILNAHA